MIGLSWPYSNGELHIGHFGSSMPADVMARYFRMQGDKVCMVSGSDCYGTPTSIQAQKEGVTPLSITEKYHKKFVDIFKAIDFSFDKYTATTDDRHVQFVQDFHRDMYKSDYITTKEDKRLYCEHCQRFLPDRYVYGICPHCHNKAKGDSCSHCGQILEPEDLLEPKCLLCDNTPVLKDVSQLYIELSKLTDQIVAYFNKVKDGWNLNAINMTQRYIDEGLQDRAITRNLDWGIPVPDCNEKDKVIYNWAENVLGYLSATKMYCDENGLNWEDWWSNDKAIHYYVHAKDNIPFHTIIFPGMLMANSHKYHLPDRVISSEYVMLDGRKVSKSEGTVVLIRELLEYIDSDYLRFYFAKNVNDKKDFNFTFQELVNSVNGEIINNWGNLVNRSLMFIKSKFSGKISVQKIDVNIEKKIKDVFAEVSEEIEQGKINIALKTILDLVDYSNKLFDEYAPWNSIKSDKTLCEKQLFNIVSLIANINILLTPYLPKGCAKVEKLLNIKENSYNYFELTKDIELEEIEPIYQRLDYDFIKEKYAKYIV